MIRLKVPPGPARIITASEFQQFFGVVYAPRSRPRGRLPEAFLEKCAKILANAPELSGYRAAPTYVMKIGPRVGYGLFAHQDVKPSELIAEYSGVLSRQWVPAARDKKNFNPYLLKFPFDSAYAIDASRRGNEARFINHSSRNHNARRAYLLRGGLPRVFFIAERAIGKGEQILLDYGRGYWKGARPKNLQP